jgi:O-antigen ligase
VLLSAVGYAVAPLEYVARQETLRWLVGGCVFLVTLRAAERRRLSRYLVYALLVVGAAIAAYGIFQFATGTDRVWHFVRPAQYAGRGSGTYICPNHFAGFLGMLLPLALSYALFARVGVVGRILLVYVVLVLTAGIAVSLSRAAWAATLVVLIAAAFSFIRRGPRAWAGVVLLGLLLAGGWYFSRYSVQAQNRLGKVELDSPRQGLRVRLLLWQSAWRMWLDHAWLGVGPGHFDARYPAYRHPEVHHRPGWVHNDYLNVLTDHGAAGGAIVVLGLVLLSMGGVTAWRRRPASTSSDTATLLGCAGGLSFAAIHAGADFSLQVPANFLLATYLAATLAGQLRQATRRHRWTSSLPVRLLASGLAVGVAGLLVTQANVTLRHAKALQIADQVQADFDLRVQALEQAIQQRPTDFSAAYRIGELFRLRSEQGLSGWDALARNAIAWYQRAGELNRYDPYIPLRIGMCLDWLERHDEAETYFDEAVRRDPNNYYVLALRGWHSVQQRKWAEAEAWLERSVKIRWWANPIAYNYLRIVRRMSEASAVPPR